MFMPDTINSVLFAPCGMNCMVCYVHLKIKKPCHGCLSDDKDKPERCKSCEIKICAASKGIKYCFECDEFPCKPVKKLEKSYLTRYKTSLIENSEYAKINGLVSLLEREQKKWVCACNGVISLHDGYCSECKKPVNDINNKE